jgi:hypothetical protein
MPKASVIDDARCRELEEFLTSLSPRDELSGAGLRLLADVKVNENELLKALREATKVAKQLPVTL